MNSEPNEQTRRKRKMLVLLPLLLLPFLALAFWALGGGKKENTIKEQEGLNAALPDANIPADEGMDKMAFYDKAEQGKKNENRLSDSGGVAEAMSPGSDSSLVPAQSAGNTLNNYGYEHTYSGNATENRIQSRLQELQQQLRDSESANRSNRNSDLDMHSNAAEVDQLNRNLQTSSQAEKDPEMDQLQDMMKRIYDIQHPELIKEALKNQSILNKGMVYPVDLLPEGYPVSFLQIPNDTLSRLLSKSVDGFYGLADNNAIEIISDAAIEASIQDNSTVVNGATLKMRLLQDVYINGAFIPKGNFIYGTATINNDRVIVEIGSVMFRNNLYNVKLSVYDTDGLEGIYVPGSISTDITKQSGDDAIQSFSIGSLDPSPGAQATTAGIETAKKLLSKKIKLVKVFIKAGHKVLLKDTHNQ